MRQQLTDAIVRRLPAPAKGNRITYDWHANPKRAVTGFGVRVTASGTCSFILNYRTRSGRERRYTIGGFPEWSTAAARVYAAELKQKVDRGEDPLEEVAADRQAKTVADLAARFKEEHLPKKRPATRRSYEALINNDILPALKQLRVADVSFSHVDSLHRKITNRGSPYQANRTVAVLSKMFSLAEKWTWIPGGSNPARGIERNQEARRRRYLSGEELARLTGALTTHPDKQVADIVRLLLLTGARRGEVQSMRWADVDISAGIWTKPGATTKQKTEHRVPLSAPARQLLSELRTGAQHDAEFVFPGRGNSGHRVELKGDWARICRTAGISGARLHDLRHTYASVLASAGLSLPVIGALLGHTQPATTARYAHLFDDPLKAATERVGAIVSGSAAPTLIAISGTEK